MQKTATTWAVGNPITATRLNHIVSDLETLFDRLSNDNLSLTYNSNGQLTQIVDSENSITINISWVDFNSATSKLYIQIAGDPLKWTITYSLTGYPVSIIYA